MKTVSRLILLAAAMLSVAAFAQTQSIPTPASSVDRGGRAVVAITMPDVSGLATKTEVNNVANTANYAAAVANNAAAMANAYDRSWTRYFLGQTRCYGQYCANIWGDGSIYVYSVWGTGVTLMPTPIAQSPATYALTTASCQGGTSVSALAYPVNSNWGKLAGSQPYDWAFQWTEGPGEDLSCGVGPG